MLTKPTTIGWWESHNASLHQTQGDSPNPHAEISSLKYSDPSCTDREQQRASSFLNQKTSAPTCMLR